MVAAVPAWWAVRLAQGDGNYADAWRASLAWASASALTLGIKHVVRRERPFRTVPGVVRRTAYPGGRAIDRYSFPSGHAAVTAAIASSLVLSHREWYVIAPAALWVVSVGVSRVWVGVHHPGDVVVGWILGAAAGWAFDRLGDAVTPDGLRREADRPALAIVLRI